MVKYHRKNLDDDEYWARRRDAAATAGVFAAIGHAVDTGVEDVGKAIGRGARDVVRDIPKFVTRTVPTAARDVVSNVRGFIRNPKAEMKVLGAGLTRDAVFDKLLDKGLEYVGAGEEVSNATEADEGGDFGDILSGDVLEGITEMAAANGRYAIETAKNISKAARDMIEEKRTNAAIHKILASHSKIPAADGLRQIRMIKKRLGNRK